MFRPIGRRRVLRVFGTENISYQTTNRPANQRTYSCSRISADRDPGPSNSHCSADRLNQRATDAAEDAACGAKNAATNTSAITLPRPTAPATQLFAVAVKVGTGSGSCIGSPIIIVIVIGRFARIRSDARSIHINPEQDVLRRY